MQRTRLQGLLAIQTAYTNQKLGAMNPVTGACAYESEGRNCVVGCLFSNAQIVYLKTHRNFNASPTDPVPFLNDWGVQCLAKDGNIGVKNLEYVTGFGLDELTTLQLMHDREWKTIQTGCMNTELHRYLTKEKKAN